MATLFKLLVAAITLLIKQSSGQIQTSAKLYSYKNPKG